MGKAFGMNVLINDPYSKDIQNTELQVLISQSDYIVPLAVATAETENLIGEGQFKAMKKGALFINASRGNLVDEAALVRALDSGRLAGCALDVGRAPDQMPTPAIAARAGRDRDAAYRRPDAAGNRAPVDGDRGAGCRNPEGPRTEGRGQRRTLDPKGIAQMKTGWLARPDCRIYYEVHGERPALVFAHGLGGNHLSWWQQVAHFGAKYTCVTFAHRGFAPSTAVPGEKAPDSYAGDLAALIDSLGLKEVRLVAQSMGGWTSIEYALREPAKVKALVMASTSGHARLPPAQARRGAAHTGMDRARARRDR